MTSFKMMTFNIKGAFFHDGANDWAYRVPLNLALIRRCAPDLIGFQEVQTRNLETYRQELTEYAYALGPETARENSTGHGYFNAIYWNPARFELLAQGSFFLSRTPEVYSRDWGTSEVRGVNWVRLRDRDSGQGFLHLNSHFPHDAEDARQQSVGVIAQQLADWRGDVPALLTADFNARARDAVAVTLEDLPDDLRAWAARGSIPPAGVVHALLRQQGFRDAFDETGHRDAPPINTYHHFLGQTFPPLGYRIDWILLLDGAQRWQARSCDILTDAEPPLYPSDHYPVLAEVALE
ncbi:MAG: endonuclease/exonuclease/phosphatase family protein [Anaerolineae bacterium]|nr:endonuclease/exonuclease/phosphatase family protein [Anaerolineae bacterium]